MTHLPPERDSEGYLVDLHQWTPDIARMIAAEHDIELGKEHLEVILLLREFYNEYSLTPAVRVFIKHIGNSLGQDKGNSLYLMKLFPGTPMKLACLIGGLPKPTNCL
ncbi:MAG: TusE/DsrC/DsvC family sulfur relay protein [Hahellaceae bacterium]|nr:TusE/DsrC/DsvC family sulfur relay protein [Hahellaceae bacterium]